jgi:hypothetical protein
MGALELAKVRYGATPRTFDAELTRLSRGDRGCATDLVAGVGALTTVVLVVLAYIDLIPDRSIWFGAAIWVGGFAAGSLAQVKSGGLRKLALREGPLVYAKIVDADAYLRNESSGRQSGRAVVVFSDNPEKAFDRDALDRVATQLAAARDRAKTSNTLLDPELEKIFSDPFSPSFVELRSEWCGVAGYWCARAVIYPERLDQRPLAIGTYVALIVAPTQRFVEHAPMPG